MPHPSSCSVISSVIMAYGAIPSVLSSFPFGGVLLSDPYPAQVVLFQFFVTAVLHTEMICIVFDCTRLP